MKRSDVLEIIVRPIARHGYPQLQIPQTKRKLTYKAAAAGISDAGVPSGDKSARGVDL